MQSIWTRANGLGVTPRRRRDEKKDVDGKGPVEKGEKKESSGTENRKQKRKGEQNESADLTGWEGYARSTGQVIEG